MNDGHEMSHGGIRSLNKTHHVQHASIHPGVRHEVGAIVVPIGDGVVGTVHGLPRLHMFMGMSACACVDSCGLSLIRVICRACIEVPGT